ncbi:MAG: helix-turn-helix domain-containing protein, partial [Pseudomonadota bacterium]
EQDILLDDLHMMNDSHQHSESTPVNSTPSQANQEVPIAHVNNPTETDFTPLEYPLDLKARETQLILEMLKQNSGHRQKTAEDLNISPRTLRYKIAKLKELGVAVP